MRSITTLSGLLFLAASAIASQTPDVSGTWLADSNASVKLIFKQKDGQLHVQELNGDKVKADFTCSLSGQECDVKQEGHPEKVMLYFNGAKLVEIRERGTDTNKERFTLSVDGTTLTEETVPLTADQRRETLLFRRQRA